MFRLLTVLLLVGCATKQDLFSPDGSRLHTANDLSLVTCVFHAKAVGQRVNDTTRYVGEGSVTVRRAQSDCFEQELKGSDDE
ncbi:MAG TPA: hypothetical protein EYQ22_03545 [Gammaproteobacteria bacterium]|jgi:hypothetical protein|nr:hypothetical protein [Gammaproteobacteria bacterium]HIK70178.1 hypothetical protein [Pseudomonadales bacterium]|tara:strand:+ start:224 stop:469 length:246 start_codon:yes stop_codon:yes gene_type:complete